MGFVLCTESTWHTQNDIVWFSTQLPKARHPEQPPSLFNVKETQAARLKCALQGEEKRLKRRRCSQAISAERRVSLARSDDVTRLHDNNGETER